MKDKIITCIQCGEEFVFSASEQERFRSRGFDFPKRCLDCREKKSKFLEPHEKRRDDQKRKQNRRRFDDDDEW